MWLIPPSPTLRFPQSGALRALPPDSFRRWVIVNLTSHCQPPPTRLLSSLKRQAKNAHTYTHTCTRAHTFCVTTGQGTPVLGFRGLDPGEK